ncbi:uncharacterized protein Z518_00279 [Rhinocladiella mackenziei CBS 650.93]|uniref:Rhinocladiella mackenziei CBS 650.93 unplaced genomic scaffold supercont1.1, whole genome shotgun sequence n=1 Tax=Rhinocladiella mackenziei CBS 650.93 TaxID=1442369 RepID=A0A0D2JIF1_9EURO|nr:uncharacterized protein Z518_00279 [Rhinocladiella mackenziei CBS 650.93]KIX09200.1 hypothetical protein Z518_00279 [Rhinocladiella mackenziei CBS 650.93]
MYSDRPNMRRICTLSRDRSVTKEEQTSFEFYKLEVGVKLSGIFESEFWRRLVFQASSEEPAVLHAVIALGSAYRSEGFNADPIENDPSHDKILMDKHGIFALLQYNKAISSLQSLMNNTDVRSLRITLITCMIFICFEFLRRNLNTGNTHLQNGLRLLREVQSEHCSKDANVLFVKTHPESVDSYLVEAFTHLNVQSALFGQGPQYIYITPHASTSISFDPIPPIFDSVQEARRQLDKTAERSVLPRQKLLLDFTAARDKPQRVLYEASAAYLKSKTNPGVTLGYAILRMYHTIATIIVSTCLSSGQESVFDSYTSDFISIILQSIDLFQKVAQHLKSSPSATYYLRRGIFTVDMEFIPVLFYTALKCRVPRIRRQAIKLILSAPHREGIWDRRFTAAVVNRVIELEEGNFYHRFNIGDFDRFDVPKSDEMVLPVLPESSRLYEVRVILPKEGVANAIIQCSRRRHEGDGSWETKFHNLSMPL